MSEFVPSPYCNPKVKIHRRIEVIKQLKGTNEYLRYVGICKYKGCKGRKYYEEDGKRGFNNTRFKGARSGA